MDKETRLDINAENFYMVLPSNGCPLTHPNNVASKYIIDWESPIILKGKWEVALVEYSFNHFPYIDGNPSWVKIWYSTKVKYQINVVEKNNIFQLFEIPVENRIRSNDVDINFKNKFLTFKANVRFAVTFSQISDLDSVETIITMHHIIHPPYYHESNVEFVKGFSYRIDIELDTYADTSAEIPYDNLPYYTNMTDLITNMNQLSSLLFKSVDYTQNGHITFDLQPYVTKAQFHSDFAKMLGYDTTIFKDHSRHTSDRKPIFKKPYEQVYIYSSVSDPILVGGVRVPLLKTVWVDTKHNTGDVLNEIVQTPMYLSISSDSINNIEINLRYDSGKLINFVEGSKTSLTLHFRKT